MKLLIKFPTRGRRDKFFSVAEKYISMCDDLENVDLLVTLDLDDQEMNTEEVKVSLDESNITYYYGISKSKIHAVNRDLEKYKKDWDILLLASDDMIPVKLGYDNIIRDHMKNHFPDTDGVLWFNDGHQGSNLNTLCILGKKYYERFGYIYNPEYISLWSDNEFMDVANNLQKQKYFDEVIIRHEHPDAGYGSRDLIHYLNVKNESMDKSTYYRRKSINFGL